jgi:exosortase
MTAIRAFFGPARPERAGTFEVRRAAPAAVLIACGMALLPWVWLQGQILWAQPHYRFIPLVPLLAAALIARDCRRLGALHPGSRRVSLAMLAASGLALAMADLFYSSLCGTVAALAAVLAAAYGLGGPSLLRAALPAWAFLLVAVRPPLYLDVALIDRLLDLATNASSPVLDLLGIVHVATGHVIETPGGRLLIEGACSGAHSLFLTEAAALFAALWYRMSWPRALALLAAGAVWALLGNVVRIVAVAYLAGRWGIDVGSGWRHQALGFVIFLMAIGLLASTDRLAVRAFGVVQSGLARWRGWRRPWPGRRPPPLRRPRRGGATGLPHCCLNWGTPGSARGGPPRRSGWSASCRWAWSGGVWTIPHPGSARSSRRSRPTPCPGAGGRSAASRSR